MTTVTVVYDIPWLLTVDDSDLLRLLGSVPFTTISELIPYLTSSKSAPSPPERFLTRPDPLLHFIRRDSSNYTTYYHFLFRTFCLWADWYVSELQVYSSDPKLTIQYPWINSLQTHTPTSPPKIFFMCSLETYHGSQIKDFCIGFYS